MPTVPRPRPRPLPRLAWLGALWLLLCAQCLTLAHAGEHAHQGDRGDEPACALCLFQAAGHPVAGPLSGPPLAAPRPWPRLWSQPQGQRLKPAAGWPLQQAARGPPAGHALA